MATVPRVLTPELYVVQAPWADRGPAVTVPTRPVPVVVSVHWQDGSTSGGHPATARAWTPLAVECSVSAHGGAYAVWLPVGDVARRQP